MLANFSGRPLAVQDTGTTMVADGHCSVPFLSDLGLVCVQGCPVAESIAQLSQRGGIPVGGLHEVRAGDQ